eukprot:1127337-Amorphochlora_amoeboformis.AAC.2
MYISLHIFPCARGCARATQIVKAQGATKSVEEATPRTAFNLPVQRISTPVAMLRSADMAYVKINVNDDEIGSAIQTLASRFGKLHIVDVCDDTKSDIKRQKTWKQTISELSHMERKLEGYADLMEKYGVKLPAMHYTNPKDFEPIGTIPGQNRNMLEECRQYFSGKGGIDERDLDNHTRVISELNQTISILKEKLEVGSKPTSSKPQPRKATT